MSDDKKKLLGEVLLEKHVIDEQDAVDALADNEDENKRLGRILISKKVISEQDLLAALAEQQASSLRLGDILVARGVATSKDILQAFALQLQQRSEISTPVQHRLSLIGWLKTTRISFRRRLAIFITLLIALIMSVASIFFYQIQKEEFISQTTRLGISLIKNFSRNCSVPLLENDDASLNVLTEEISKIRDVDYVKVIDTKQTVLVHSDISKIGLPYQPIRTYLSREKYDQIEITSYRDNKRELLDFSIPVTFSKVMLGTVHLGISLDSLNRKIMRSGLFILAFTTVLIAVGIGLSLYIGTQFSRPILNLLHGTTEIKSGNFSFRTERLQNDELGDLTLAFNDMAEGLRKKKVIQDAFGKYVTPEIVEMILKNPENQWFQGRKLTATVMFTDIRGFTSFSEKHPAEEVVSVLNEHFTTATEIILRHGGHVDKFIGDAVLAVFGALMEYDDHAERAVQAAIALQRILKTKDTESGFAISIGIGINSGELIAGNIGSQKRMEYTVIGDTVNLASRLTALAAPGEIIISSATHGGIETAMEMERLEPVAVKGKTEKVEIYRVRVGV